MMKTSLLIPLKHDNGQRDLLWAYIKRRYELLMPQVELCIGLDESEPSCKAKAVNKAASFAQGELFIIVDADVIFNPTLIDKIASIIHKYSWIIPFKNGYRLTEEATNRLIKQGLLQLPLIEPADILRNQTTKGALMNAVTRSKFEAVSGFDERFKGYGNEDIAFHLSLETICGHHHRMNEVIYHLWHQPADRNTKETLNNKTLCRKYEAAKNNVKKMKKLIQERYWNE